MTAPHVIEKLKRENDWFLTANNEHEFALILNAAYDSDMLGENAKSIISSYPFLGIGIKKTHVNTCSGSKIISCHYMGCDIYENNLTGWFFKEVNNY